MSELFFNRGDDQELKTGIQPQVPSPHLHPYGDNPTVILRDDGLYDRTDIDQAFLERFSHQIETDPSSLSLGDWRLWLQHAWKAEHGSKEAAKRFGGKLIEEYQELKVALRAFREDPTEQARTEAVSEAGDVL